MAPENAGGADSAGGAVVGAAAGLRDRITSSFGAGFFAARLPAGRFAAFFAARLPAAFPGRRPPAARFGGRFFAGRGFPVLPRRAAGRFPGLRREAALFVPFFPRSRRVGFLVRRRFTLLRLATLFLALMALRAR
jgi:hypothetical protein